MDNVQIAEALNEVADLLEIQGDNPFRVRAYRTGARAIGDLTRSVADMLSASEDLEEIPGIGHDLAAHIAELVETGRLARLDELRRQIPPTLADLLKIEGLGPKRAKRLHDELGIDSLDALDTALQAGRVTALKGFGERTVEKLRRGLGELRARPRRFRLADAERAIDPLVRYLRESPAVERLEVAGSYRRRLETVGDADLLVISKDVRSVMKRFTAYPDVARIEASGDTRGTVVLMSGLHVDLRVLPARSYGSALHYFTGSKAHSIELRRLALEKRLRVSEYGVFRIGKGAAGARRIGGAEEEDVFAAVGMDWVPPELRENRGEIEAALAHALPHLVELADIRGDLQVHTDWSDGQDSLEDMALAALEGGYEYLAITDHSPSVAIASGLSARDFEAQWKEITRLRRKLKGTIHLLRGAEVDILADGRLDLPDSHLGRLDVVVAAVHGGRRMSRAAMTERVIRGISHPAVHILAHPTGRLINRREPADIDLDAVLKAAARLGVAVEINAQPDRLDLSDIQARRARELGVRLVVDTDAHSTGTLDFMRYGVDQARRAWLEQRDVLNTLPLDRLQRRLATMRRSPARQSARRAGKPPRQRRKRVTA